MENSTYTKSDIQMQFRATLLEEVESVQPVIGTLKVPPSRASDVERVRACLRAPPPVASMWTFTFAAPPPRAPPDLRCPGGGIARTTGLHSAQSHGIRGRYQGRGFGWQLASWTLRLPRRVAPGGSSQRWLCGK